jgi:hypothetical protein
VTLLPLHRAQVLVSFSVQGINGLQELLLTFCIDTKEDFFSLCLRIL